MAKAYSKCNFTFATMLILWISKKYISLMYVTSKNNIAYFTSDDEVNKIFYFFLVILAACHISSIFYVTCTFPAISHVIFSPLFTAMHMQKFSLMEFKNQKYPTTAV